jgi:hypothetical protein
MRARWFVAILLAGMAVAEEIDEAIIRDLEFFQVMEVVEASSDAGDLMEEVAPEEMEKQDE